MATHTVHTYYLPAFVFFSSVTLCDRLGCLRHSCGWVITILWLVSRIRLVGLGGATSWLRTSRSIAYRLTPLHLYLRWTKKTSSQLKLAWPVPSLPTLESSWLHDEIALSKPAQSTLIVGPTSGSIWLERKKSDGRFRWSVTTATTQALRLLTWAKRGGPWRHRPKFLGD